MIRWLRRLYGNWRTLDRMDRWALQLEQRVEKIELQSRFNSQYRDVVLSRREQEGGATAEARAIQTLQSRVRMLTERVAELRRDNMRAIRKDIEQLDRTGTD